MEQLCGQVPEGGEGKLVWLESKSKRERGMRKSSREAGPRSLRLVCTLKGVKQGKGQDQLWAVPDLL